MGYEFKIRGDDDLEKGRGIFDASDDIRLGDSDTLSELPTIMRFGSVKPSETIVDTILKQITRKSITTTEDTNQIGTTEKFTCPYCQKPVYGVGGTISYFWNGTFGASYQKVDNYRVLTCKICDNVSIFIQNGNHEKLIHPIRGILDLPSKAMPDKLKNLYDDANIISAVSIRGAVASLRICLEEITVDRGVYVANDLEKSTINLIEKEGLSKKRHMHMLDLIRKAGNGNSHARNMIEFNADDLQVLSRSILYIVRDIYEMEQHDKDVSQILEKVEKEEKKRKRMLRKNKDIKTKNGGNTVAN